ncbi:MAG: DUF4199 domain-containing protein [Bacteroidales bacterium]
MELKSIYKSAANDGLIFGGYLTAIFISYVLASVNVMFAWVLNLLILAIPYVTYRFIRRCNKGRFNCMSISEMWMYGMLLYIYGALICGIVTFAYIRFIEPNLITNQLQMALDIYKSVDELKDSEFVAVVEQGIEQGLVPSAIDFVIQMMWVTSFFGSVLSLIIALIIRLINRNK